MPAPDVAPPADQRRRRTAPAPSLQPFIRHASLLWISSPARKLSERAVGPGVGRRGNCGIVKETVSTLLVLPPPRASLPISPMHPIAQPSHPECTRLLPRPDARQPCKC